MIFLYAVLLVVAYAVAASWAVSHGSRRRLWLTALATLVLLGAAAVLLGRHYAVPSLGRLLLYKMAFTGPVVVVPTVLLSFSKARPTWVGWLPVALLGACIGIICGWVLVVFGLGVW